MKTSRINKICAALIAIVVLSSCTDLFKGSDLNQNPNSPVPSQVDLSPLTTGTLVGLGQIQEGTDVRIAYMWGGQLAGQSRQHQGFANYTVAASTFGWANYYNTGANIKLIQQKASAVNNKAHLGVAQVMEALLFTQLISLWGDVPYSEAFDAVNHPFPKYDGQLSLYSTLISELDAAYTNLTSGTGKIVGDFVFGGSATKWAAAAKTLQARLYLHLKDYPKAAAAAALGISSTAGDMLMPHGTAYQVDANQNWSFFDQDRPGDTSFDPPAYLPKFMCTDIATGVYTADVAKRNAKTDETGLYFHFFQYGAETSGLDPNTIDGFFVQNASQPWLTFYENQLILAEAIARQSAAGAAADPAALAALNSVRAALATGYINGQTTSYSAKGLTYTPYIATDFDKGGIANPGTKFPDGKTALLTEISSEKFVTLLSQYEVFNELRRLQVATPVISLGIPFANGSVFPGRFIYPQQEINTNPNTPNPAPNQFAKLPVFQ